MNVPKEMQKQLKKIFLYIVEITVNSVSAFFARVALSSVSDSITSRLVLAQNSKTVFIVNSAKLY